MIKARWGHGWLLRLVFQGFAFFVTEIGDIQSHWSGKQHENEEEKNGRSSRSRHKNQLVREMIKAYHISKENDLCNGHPSVSSQTGPTYL